MEQQKVSPNQALVARTLTEVGDACLVSFTPMEYAGYYRCDASTPEDLDSAMAYLEDTFLVQYASIGPTLCHFQIL